MNRSERHLQGRRASALGPVPSAFSLVEILIVIGVIAVLVSILLVGFGTVLGGAQKKQTQATLGTLQNMLAELDSKTRLGKGPPHWRWLAFGTTTPVDATTGDFWRTPFTLPTGPDTLDAPGNVDPSVDARSRNASRAILNTQLAMTMMLALPSNRSTMQQLSADRLFVPVWDDNWTSNFKIPTPGADGVFNGDESGATEDIIYPQGVTINFLQHDPTSGAVVKQTLMVCVVPQTPGNVTGASPNWQNTTSSVPLLLDAWNNPIIFVPGSGLRVRKLDGATAFDPTDKSQTFIIVSSEGSVARLNDNSVAGRPTAGTPYVIKVGRPFFASAGPDGDFAKGDDNVYSFEK